MITPNEPIVIPAQTFDGLWVTELTVYAYDPTGIIQGQIKVAPFNSTTGKINRDLEKNIVLNDIATECQTNQTLATAMAGVYAAVQAIVTNGNLF